MNSTIRDLAVILLCEPELIALLYRKRYKVVRGRKDIKIGNSESDHLMIKSYSIRKRSLLKRTRSIHSPLSERLKSCLKILSVWLTQEYTPNKCVHGFVKNRGIKTNASMHLACKYLLKLDIKNFYEQIHRRHIIKSLVKLGISKERAKVIAKITTINGSLPQGFNTSPVLSNIVASEMDGRLEEYCLKNNLTYTRYADDMTFSSKIQMPNFLDLKEIVESNGFYINKSKTRRTIRGNYQSVTGLTVFDHQQPRIPKRIKRKLRLEAYYINKYGIKNHAIRRLVKKGGYNNNPDAEVNLRKEIEDTRSRLSGWVNFSKGIESGFAVRLEGLLMSRRMK